MNLQVAVKVTETSGHIASDQVGTLRQNTSKTNLKHVFTLSWFYVLVTMLVKTLTALAASEPPSVCFIFCT